MEAASRGEWTPMAQQKKQKQQKGSSIIQQSQIEITLRVKKISNFISEIKKFSWVFQNKINDQEQTNKGKEIYNYMQSLQDELGNHSNQFKHYDEPKIIEQSKIIEQPKIIKQPQIIEQPKIIKQPQIIKQRKEEKQEKQEKQVVYKIRKKCNKYHKLQNMEGTNKCYLCDVCKKNKISAKRIWGCRKCNWDICKQCRNKYTGWQYV